MPSTRHRAISSIGAELKRTSGVAASDVMVICDELAARFIDSRSLRIARRWPRNALAAARAAWLELVLRHELLLGCFHLRTVLVDVLCEFHGLLGPHSLLVLLC